MLYTEGIGHLNAGEREAHDHAIELALSSPHGEERAAVVHESFEWMGTPWRHMNRIKGRGADCGNFPASVFARVGAIAEPELFRYTHQFYLHSKEELFRDKLEQFCDRLGEVEPLPGDIIALQFNKEGPTVCHIGITVAHPQFIHARGGAYSRDGAVELGDLTGPYLKLWSGTWRLHRWA